MFHTLSRHNPAPAEAAGRITDHRVPCHAPFGLLGHPAFHPSSLGLSNAHQEQAKIFPTLRLPNDVHATRPSQSVSQKGRDVSQEQGAAFTIVEHVP